MENYPSVPVPIFRVLAASNVAVSHTGNTNETIIATVNIPAGAMGLNGQLRVTSLWSTPGGSGNNKTLRMRMNGLAGTSIMGTTQTTNLSYADTARIIGSRNSATSQVSRNSGLPAGGATAAAIGVAGVNTNAAWTLDFTATLANSGETITLEQYTVEILRA
jgi:hypothetical protein